MISLLQILPRAQKWHITIIRRLELAARKRPARIFKMLKQSCKSQQNNTGRAAPPCVSRYITKFGPLPHHFLFWMFPSCMLLGVVYKQPRGKGISALETQPIHVPCSGFPVEADGGSLGFFSSESGVNQLTTCTYRIVCLGHRILFPCLTSPSVNSAL